MAYKLAEAFVEMTLHNEQFRQGMGSAKQFVRQSVTDLQGLVGQLGIGIGGGALMGSALALASTAEQTATRFEVMLGDAEAAKRVNEELNQFSAVTPFEPGPIKDAASSLLAFRTSTEDLTDRLRVLGDIAAGTGKPLAEYVQIFNKVKSQGKVTGETFEQLAERGVALNVVLDEMGVVAQENYREMQAAGKIGFDELLAAMEHMTGEQGMFFNSMKKQSTTFAGLWSTITGHVKLFGAEVGGTYRDALKPFMTAVIELQVWLKALNDESGGAVAQVLAMTLALVTAKGASLALAAAGYTLSGALRAIVVGGSAIAAKFALIAGVIMLVKKLVETIAEMPAVQAAWNRATAAFKGLWEAIAPVVSQLRDVFAQFFEQTDNWLSQFGLSFDQLISKAGEWAAGMVDAVAGWATDIMEWMWVISENWDTVQELMRVRNQKFWIGLRDTFYQLPEIIAWVYGRVARGIVDAVMFLIEWIPKVWETLVETLQNMMSRLWDNIQRMFRGEKLEALFEGATNALIEKARSMAEAGLAGFNKESLSSILKMSDEYKALAKQEQQLIDRLLAAKRLQEEFTREDQREDAERAARIGAQIGMGLIGANPFGIGGQNMALGKAAAKIEEAAESWSLSAGFLGFQDAARKAQETLLKNSKSADEKMVGFLEQGNMQRDKQVKLLEDINDGVAPLAEVGVANV